MNGQQIQATEDALSDLMGLVISDPERYLDTLEMMLTSLMRSQQDPDMMIDAFELWRALIHLFASKA